MEEAETKTCTNCKRDIPAVNFTTHAVHCARNIGVCPVCKEPVPHAELDEHNNKLHKLMPCKQCGESVCGTDLEDHIRDSCANTVQNCRYCELGLPRRELPAHEAYCGSRTELCPDCKEFVMLKYRQIHVQSNHGFLRLDDDPEPVRRPVRPAHIGIRPPQPAPATGRGAIDLGELVGGLVRERILPEPRQRDRHSDARVSRPADGTAHAQSAVKKRPAPRPPAAAAPRPAPPLSGSVKAANNPGPPANAAHSSKQDRHRNGHSDGHHRPPRNDYESRRKDLKNLQPMSQQQFMQRVNNLAGGAGGVTDRFSEIKSSLRELRRGLNEVTAPYNVNSNSTTAVNNGAHQDEVRLPCEFCSEAVLVDELVQHQTGCRPDLAQLRINDNANGRENGTPRDRGASRGNTRGHHREHDRGDAPGADDYIPLIPCEFCAEPLPIHLVSHHQERCGRDGYEDSDAFAI